MSMLKIKVKCLSSLDANAGPLVMIRLAPQVPRPCWLTVYALSGLFWNLEGVYPWLVWCSLFWQGIKNCAENHASPEQFVRIIWEAGFWAVVLSLAQMKHFSMPLVVYWLFLSMLPGIVSRISEKRTWGHLESTLDQHLVPIMVPWAPASSQHPLSDSVSFSWYLDLLVFFFFFFATPCGMRDLVPLPGIELCPLQWECPVLTTGPPGKSPGPPCIKWWSTTCFFLINFYWSMVALQCCVSLYCTTWSLKGVPVHLLHEEDLEGISRQGI